MTFWVRTFTWRKVWSQLALAYNALARLLDALYLIFKFVIALWQSSDNDVRSFQHTARNKQTLTDLEFVLGHTPQYPYRAATLYRAVSSWAAAASEHGFGGGPPWVRSFGPNLRTLS
jgi:hypothetical protein